MREVFSTARKTSKSFISVVSKLRRKINLAKFLSVISIEFSSFSRFLILFYKTITQLVGEEEVSINSITTLLIIWEKEPSKREERNKSFITSQINNHKSRSPTN